MNGRRIEGKALPIINAAAFTRLQLSDEDAGGQDCEGTQSNRTVFAAPKM